MLNIILFGPPGAGKGTQSEGLLNKYGLKHISTGDLLRAERKSGTTLGLEADKFISAGDLVPDSVVIGMVENFMTSNHDSEGFIFDGFPRTIPQAEALDILLEKHNTKIHVVLGLEVDEDELVKRLLLRGESSGRADDKDESTIRNRFQEYENKTLPIKSYYSKLDKYVGIQGIGEIQEIFGQLCSHVDECLK
jgi:adenylate kinase